MQEAHQLSADLEIPGWLPIAYADPDARQHTSSVLDWFANWPKIFLNVAPPRMKSPLSQTQPLDLMISSRCTDTILYEGKLQPMEVLRRAIKSQLESIKIGGKQLFRVWIHEDESNGDAVLSNWDKCLEKARDADVFIALYNGRSGWLGTDSPIKGGMGICHAELSEAYDHAPGKVRCIRFKSLVIPEPRSPDAAFQKYFHDRQIPAAQAKDGEEALERVEELAAAIILSLAREGVAMISSGKAYTGIALQWRRMSFRDRSAAMSDALMSLFIDRGGKSIQDLSAPNGVTRVVALDIHGESVGFICHSIPGPMGTAAARELVGQPFLKDHEHTRKWPTEIYGPVHVIACQKSVSESQAVRQLGFPDAIVVSAPFGVYVADDVQKIQMAFVTNCRDPATTVSRVQTFLNWLNDHGEAEYLVERAKDRRDISDFIRERHNHRSASHASHKVKRRHKP